MLDINTKGIDIETCSKIALANIEACLKGLENQKLPQAINILESEVRELKKKSLELNEFKNDFLTARYNQLQETPKKFSIMDWFK